LTLGLLPLNFGEYDHLKGIRVLTSHTHSIGCAIPQYIADSYFSKVRSSACVCTGAGVRALVCIFVSEYVHEYRNVYYMILYLLPQLGCHPVAVVGNIVHR
jgi:hypothetical protein